MRDSTDLNWLKGLPVVLAVSGGSDSMALLFQCVEAGYKDLHVVTVDHGLREAAKDEALFVKSACSVRNIPHETISVEVAQTGNLQSNARDARYAALMEYCARNGSNHVFFGHTADDQAETFLLRAFRGSGVDGLSGMPFSRTKEGVTFLRPLIDCRREELRDILRQNDWAWVEDPSNEDRSFDRVKIRNLLREAESAGFAISGLLQSASNMDRAKLALDPIAQEFFAQNVQVLPLDVEDHIERDAFAKLPPFIATKVLGQFCQKFGGSDYLPRRDGIDRLYEQIMAGEEGGMAIARTDFHWSKRRIRVCAEFSALPKPCVGGRWHRWQIRKHSDLKIGALGEKVGMFSHWKALGVSHRAAQTIPALFDGDALVLVHGEALSRAGFELV